MVEVVALGASRDDDGTLVFPKAKRGGEGDGAHGARWDGDRLFTEEEVGVGADLFPWVAGVAGSWGVEWILIVVRGGGGVIGWRWGRS